MGNRRISVVIACVNGLPCIDECLSALGEERQGHDLEVIVANCARDGSSMHIKERFPWVVLLDFSRRLGIPELRAEGISRATGDIVSIIEDHCIVHKGWVSEILRAHQQGYEAVGGTVINASTSRLTDWVVFLCEYSGVMPPAPYGEVDSITGNNASYLKKILDRVDASVMRSCWEFFLHEELKKSGVRFFSEPSIVVSHKKEFGFAYFMSQRFHYSRSFAGMRRGRVSAVTRAFYVFASPLIPGLMLWRMARQIYRKGEHMDKFLWGLPLLMPFLMSYAAGEFVGYLLGGGESLLRVE